jgi:hypothetical protein
VDLLLFDPAPGERRAIERIREFWKGNGQGPFTGEQILGCSAVLADGASAEKLRDWLTADREQLALDDLVLRRLEDGRWEAEHVTPHSPAALALRILPQLMTASSPRNAENPVSLVAYVYEARRQLLDGRPGDATDRSAPPPVPVGLDAFVDARLRRCGFGALRPDVRSLMELCDIFDEYDFRQGPGGDIS